jgi:hypothetical protein
MNQKMLKQLRDLYEHLSFYNEMAPFPIYDTEYVDAVKQLIIKMEETKKDYESLPVAACKHCKSLHIVLDEVDNDVCMRCGAVNEIEIYKDIDEYLALKNAN